jgi:hypothetical protein
MRSFAAEDLARALHRRLRNALWLHRPRVLVTVEGAGVHWTCHTASATRRTSTDCFGANDAEFLTAFHDEDGEPAWARTAARGDAVAAILRWQAGAARVDMYDQFPFVDAVRRAFTDLQRAVYAADPRLAARVTASIVHSRGDGFVLTFTADARSIRLSFYGRNPHPDATLSWDGCAIAETTVVEPRSFAVVVGRWLIDQAMPSAMRREFPGLALHPAAPYYEAGNPIEGEFLISWDLLETFFGRVKVDAPRRLALIAALRAAGFDRKLRAGQSLTSMLLSRARNHGLADGQPFVRLEFHNGFITIDAAFAGITGLERPLGDPPPELLELLHALAARAIA